MMMVAVTVVEDGVLAATAVSDQHCNIRVSRCNGGNGKQSVELVVKVAVITEVVVKLWKY